MQPRAVSSATTARKLSQRRRLVHGGQGRNLPRPLAARRGTPAPTATTAPPARRAKEGKRMTARSAGRREKRKIKPKAAGLNWTERRRERAERDKKKEREREKKKASDKKRSSRKKRRKSPSSSSEMSSSSELADSSHASGGDSDGSSSSDPDSVSTWTMLKPLFAMADRPDYLKCKRKVRF